MIDPAFLASLRREHNCQHLLLLVQLEQFTPHWWVNQNEMADDLGIQRASLFRGLHWLRTHNLIRTCGSNHGTYLWWVCRSFDDSPDKAITPAWTLRDLRSIRYRIPLGTERDWCNNHNIQFRNFQNFIGGRVKLLGKRWQLIGCPWDHLHQPDAA